MYPNVLQALLDLRLTANETDAQKLQTDHNSRASVSRLHSEMLNSIFLLCAPDPKTWHSVSRDLAFTHVCHLWRKTAIDYSVIWARPIFCVPELAREMIKRSGTCLLDIHYSSSKVPPASIAVLSKALSLSHRIRVLEIEVHMHSHLTRAQALFHLLARRMPSLQSISITYVPGGTDSTNPQFNLLLPPTFLCGQTPSHTTVFHLERCHVSWSFVSKLTNLTHLHLDGSSDRMHRPSEMEFYRMLQRSPRLRELKLGVYAIPAATSATIPSLALTELRHLSLQSSIFSSETINCGRLLDNISFPTTAKFTLEIDGLSVTRPTEPIIDILLPLFNSLAPHLQASSPDVYSVYRSAIIQCNVVKRDRSVNYESFGLKAWHEEFNSVDKFDACGGSKGSSDVGVVCSWDARLLQPHSSPTEQGKIATAALHMIPSTFIKTLYISLEFPPGPPTDFKFASLLAPYMHSTKLVRLFVCGTYCGAGVMRALSEASAEQAALPALQAVTLINVSRPGKDGFELGTMQALFSYLDCRIKHQVQLPVITIEPKGRGTSIDVTYEELFGWIVNRQHQPS